MVIIEQSNCSISDIKLTTESDTQELSSGTFTQSDHRQLVKQVIEDFSYCLDEYHDSVLQFLTSAAEIQSKERSAFLSSSLGIGIFVLEPQQLPTVTNNQLSAPVVETKELSTQHSWIIRYGLGGVDANIMAPEAFVPLTHIPFILRDQQGNTIVDGVLNEQGESALLTGLNPNQEYILTFHPQLDIKDYYHWLEGYQPVITALQQWLIVQANDEAIIAGWQHYLAESSDGQLQLEAEGVLSESHVSIQTLADFSAKILSFTPSEQIKIHIQDLSKQYLKIQHVKQSAYDNLMDLRLDEMLSDVSRTQELLQRISLLAQDDALIYLHIRVVIAWYLLLPPQERGKISIAIICEIIIFVLTGSMMIGAGESIKETQAIISIAYPLGINAAQSLLQTLHDALPSVLAHNRQIFTCAQISIRLEDSFWERNGQRIVELRQKIQPHTQVKVDVQADFLPECMMSAYPSVSDIALTDDSLSMVNGEELLSLEDITLPGILPVTFSRLYRTSVATRQYGLGYGWSHSFCHQLHFTAQNILWTNDKGRVVTLPLVTEAEYFVSNPQTKVDLYWLAPNQYLIRTANNKLQYEFIRHGKHGRLMAIRDRYDNQVSFYYNESGQLMRVTSGQLSLLFTWQQHLLHAVFLAQYDSASQVWQPLSQGMQYHYNQQQQLVRSETVGGEAECYTYDIHNVLLSRKLAGGAMFYWQWEGEAEYSRCIHHWGNFPQLNVRYEWDLQQNIGMVINADGSREIYRHDTQARLIGQVAADGAERRYYYSEQGQKIAEVDAQGQQTRYLYDQQGELSAIFYADSREIHFEYQLGYIKAIREGDKIWRYRRNHVGDILELIAPDGLITSYRYDKQGQCIEKGYPDGTYQYWTWGKQGELLETHLSNGCSRRYFYNELLLVSGEQDEFGRMTHYDYDVHHRLSRIGLPDGQYCEYHYNAYGKVTQLIDEKGQITRYEYAQPLHLLTRKILPDGSDIKYRYNNVHLQLSEIENAKGDIYRIYYTPGGLVSEEIGFDDVKVAYRYNLNGQLIEKREFGTEHNSAPLITHYLRDAAGRLLTKILPDGLKEQYRYDEYGRLVEVLDSTQVLAWEYDLGDRLVAEHQNWATLRHRYNELTGLLSASRLPDGQWLNYYNIAGQLRGMTLNGRPLVAFDYDVCQQEIQRRQGNGLVCHYQYDAGGRVTHYQLQECFQHNPNVLVQSQYQYQADGLLTQISGSRYRHYRYDKVGQLVSADYCIEQEGKPFYHQQTYDYDAAGNRISPEAVCRNNRLTYYAERHFEYDKFGNLIAERCSKTHQLIAHYIYDCRHRLSRVETESGQISTYTYDAFNRRTSKTVNGYMTEFIWQGSKLVAECADKDTYWKSYLYTPGSYHPLAMVIGHRQKVINQPVYWYQNDHLGIPYLLTSIQGESVYLSEYDAYGNTLMEKDCQTEQQEPFTQPFRLPGQYYDAESGLHYNLHRYYHPYTGRYLTPDPSRIATGLNAYQYASGNPVTYTDPLGLEMLSSKATINPEPMVPRTYQQSGREHYSEMLELPATEPGEHYYNPIHWRNVEADKIIEENRYARNNITVSPEEYMLDHMPGNTLYMPWFTDPKVTKRFIWQESIMLSMRVLQNDDQWFQERIINDNTR